MNLVVENPEGIRELWDGKDFVFVHKNKMYALKKTDERYPLMINQLLKQNNCITMQEFNEKYNKRYNNDKGRKKQG